MSLGLEASVCHRDVNQLMDAIFDHTAMGTRTVSNDFLGVLNQQPTPKANVDGNWGIAVLATTHFLPAGIQRLHRRTRLSLPYAAHTHTYFQTSGHHCKQPCLASSISPTSSPSSPPPYFSQSPPPSPRANPLPSPSSSPTSSTKSASPSNPDPAAKTTIMSVKASSNSKSRSPTPPATRKSYVKPTVGSTAIWGTTLIRRRQWRGRESVWGIRGSSL
ncbi:hypothetical protein P154DRAFT_269956 [Amniculicola lignicola CBS 123094]|uniref:Uncharacterized protein n=1 Tax=Amniculicola lignicola CBS 123094 TaxID=1392246 RepID=A0A6A5W941_9PLEO|nr:hypothetical protein P154DRAFT_269956 [Amniculicola lignicola CBS 123094]